MDSTIVGIIGRVICVIFLIFLRTRFARKSFIFMYLGRIGVAGPTNGKRTHFGLAYPGLCLLAMVIVLIVLARHGRDGLIPSDAMPLTIRPPYR